MAWRAQREASWSQKRKWWDHKPSSVYSLVRADGHLSGMTVASHLVRPTRSSSDPGRVSLLIWPCSDRGLPCHACCQARGGLLPHRFTLTLWIQGRSVLCGPVPSPRGAQVLPGGLPCGARTFLDRPLQPAYRDHRPHHFQRQENYRSPGALGKAHLAKRRMTRAKLSEAVPSSQKPACSPNTIGRSRAQSAGESRSRSGTNSKADSATMPRPL